MTKTCNSCREEKPVTEFHKHKDGHQAKCKPCNRALVSKWRAENPEKEKAKQAKYYSENTADAKARMANYKKANQSKIRTLNLKKYGITLAQYEQMFADQAGCCAICKTHQSEFSKSLAVDHCHTSGKVRGLLCGLCNTALGSMRDSPEILASAINYLRKVV